MLKAFLRFGSRIRDRYLAARDPVKFARFLGVRVGSGVRFYGINRSMFGSEPWLITIGNNVFITAEVQFLTHDGGTLPLRREVADLEWTAPISIGDDVFIGFRSVLMPGVSVGNRCIVGACSVVTRSVPDNSVVVGNPARMIKSTDAYLESLKKKSLKCGHLPAMQKASYLMRHYGVKHI